MTRDSAGHSAPSPRSRGFERPNDTFGRFTTAEYQGRRWPATFHPLDASVSALLVKKDQREFDDSQAPSASPLRDGDAARRLRADVDAH